MSCHDAFRYVSKTFDKDAHVSKPNEDQHDFLLEFLKHHINTVDARNPAPVDR